MNIKSATDKIFNNDNNQEIAEQDHSTKEECFEAPQEVLLSPLPTIFSIAAGTSKDPRVQSLEEVVALCKEQRNKPLRDQYTPIAYAVKIGRYDAVKFLIDQGESVNEANPDMPVWYSNSPVGVEPGRTPLEIAIGQGDEEMVKILTTYHPENRATPEISYQRYLNLRAQKDHYNIDKKQLKAAPSSPLLDALKTGNQEIIDLVIKAYTDPKRLYADRTAIQTPEAMRSWIQQNVFLWKGELQPVSDEVVSLFLSNQGLNCSDSDAEKLLQHGWKVTKKEFEQAVAANRHQIVQLCITHPRIEEASSMLIQECLSKAIDKRAQEVIKVFIDNGLSYEGSTLLSKAAESNLADVAAYLIKRGDLPTREHLDAAIKHGSLDVVRVFVEQGLSIDGVLEIAIDQRQFGIAGYLASKATIDQVIAICRAQMDKPLFDRYPPMVFAAKIGHHEAVKFFIDNGASVNTASPDIPVRSGTSSYPAFLYDAGVCRGYTPLEIAIAQQDTEMVKILTTYHPENRAIPEITYERSRRPLAERDGYYVNSSSAWGQASSPLLDALKRGNQEIINLVLKAYTDPQRLYAEFAAVQSAKQPEVMRAWIEQHFFLLNGERKEASEKAVDAFLHKQGLNGDFSTIEQFLQFGWIVTKQEFEQALKANDPQILTLLLDYPRVEENQFFALARANRADLISYMIKQGNSPTSEHLDIAIRHNSTDAALAFIKHDASLLRPEHLDVAAANGLTDVVHALIENGVSSKKALGLAVDHRRLEIAKYLISVSKDFYNLVEVCRAQSDKPLLYRYPPIAFAVEFGLHDVVKFLLDHGESVNSATPDAPVFIHHIHDWDSRYDHDYQVGVEQGRTPLEIAIKKQDTEMVRILTTYHPENRAIVEIGHTRCSTNRGPRGDSGYWGDSNGPNPFVTESLLSDALKTKNQEIIDLVLRAYADSDKLCAAYSIVQASKSPETMRTWIEQNVFLWKGEHSRVSDAVVELFMENLHGIRSTASNVETLLAHGWNITREEFEQALLDNDPQILQLVIDHPRMQESPFNLLAKYNRADLASYLIAKGSVPTRDSLEIAVTHGALDVVKIFVGHGIDLEGILLFATKEKQKAIVAYLLDLPMDKEQIEKAHEIAYQLHAYDIMELLKSKM